MGRPNRRTAATCVCEVASPPVRRRPVGRNERPVGAPLWKGVSYLVPAAPVNVLNAKRRTPSLRAGPAHLLPVA